MEHIRNVFITPEEFEEIQSKYDGICEYLKMKENNITSYQIFLLCVMMPKL